MSTPKFSLKSDPLEIEKGPAEAAEASRRNEALAKATSVSRAAKQRLANQDLMVQAMREKDAAEINWHRARWRFLKVFLAFLVGYFALSAFFDFVSFVAGVKILLGFFKQIAIEAAIYFVYLQLRARVSPEQLEYLRPVFRSLAKKAGAVILLYSGYRGLAAVTSILVSRGRHGLRWNYPFAYFLVVCAGSAVICFFLWRLRDNAKRAQREIRLGECVPDVSLRQLSFVQFACEGITLNIGLMLFFQLAFGVDVPLGLFHALSQPLLFLFYFFPGFSYLFFRSYFESFYS